MESSGQTATGEPSPILVPASAGAKLCNISVRQWWRWDSEGVIPKAVRVGKTKRWRVQELLAWISAGCPRRKQWEEVRDGQGS